MRLPPEVLRIIFRMVHDSEPLILPGSRSATFDSCPTPSKFSYRWIGLVHVCHHWRAVVATCAPLWSTVDVVLEKEWRLRGGSGKFPLFTNNSKKQALVVQMVVKNTPMPSPILRFLQEQERFRELSLFGEMPQEGQDALSSQAAKTLRVLALHCSFQGINSWKKRTPVFPNLFQKQYPQLESLAFSSYLRYGSNQFPALKQLHMAKQVYESEGEVAGMVRMLEGIQTLEELMFSRLGYNPRIILARDAEGRPGLSSSGAVTKKPVPDAGFFVCANRQFCWPNQSVLP